MRTAVLIALLAAPPLAAALLGGCAGALPASEAADAPPPAWVLVVPEATAERVYFVGGRSASPTREEGLASAEADARSQADQAARERMRALADAALRDAGVETSGVERAGFRALVLDAVAERLAATLAVEESFARPCPSPGEPQAVCEAFVLMSAETSLWERLPEEVLAGLRVQQERAVKEKAVRLLDWMLARYRESMGGAEARPGDDTNP